MLLMLLQKIWKSNILPSISLFKLFNHIKISIKSAVALNSAPVVLLAVNFCFFDFQQTGTHPIYFK